MSASTPLVGIGMSNGARFVTLWGQVWKNGGYPVKAIWASMGRIAGPVSAPGRAHRPDRLLHGGERLHRAAGPIVTNFYDTQQAGTPTELYFSQERELASAPYLRIPGIDQSEAGADRGRAQGHRRLERQGKRVVSDIEQAAAQAATAQFPPSVAGQLGGSPTRPRCSWRSTSSPPSTSGRSRRSSTATCRARC